MDVINTKNKQTSLICEELPHLQDEEHGSCDDQRKNVERICCRQVCEPQSASGLQAGHRQVRHLSQGNEEGDEDWSLRDTKTQEFIQSLSYQNLKPVYC